MQYKACYMTQWHMPVLQANRSQHVQHVRELLYRLLGKISQYYSLIQPNIKFGKMPLVLMFPGDMHKLHVYVNECPAAAEDCVALLLLSARHGHTGVTTHTAA